MHACGPNSRQRVLAISFGSKCWSSRSCEVPSALANAAPRQGVLSVGRESSHASIVFTPNPKCSGQHEAGRKTFFGDSNVRALRGLRQSFGLYDRAKRSNILAIDHLSEAPLTASIVHDAKPLTLGKVRDCRCFLAVILRRLLPRPKLPGPPLRGITVRL